MCDTPGCRASSPAGMLRWESRMCTRLVRARRTLRTAFQMVTLQIPCDLDMELSFARCSRNSHTYFSHFCVLRFGCPTDFHRQAISCGADGRVVLWKASR